MVIESTIASTTVSFVSKKFFKFVIHQYPGTLINEATEATYQVRRLISEYCDLFPEEAFDDIITRLKDVDVRKQSAGDARFVRVFKEGRKYYVEARHYHKLAMKLLKVANRVSDEVLGTRGPIPQRIARNKARDSKMDEDQDSEIEVLRLINILAQPGTKLKRCPKESGGAIVQIIPPLTGSLIQEPILAEIVNAPLAAADIPPPDSLAIILEECSLDRNSDMTAQNAAMICDETDSYSVYYDAE